MRMTMQKVAEGTDDAPTSSELITSLGLLENSKYNSTCSVRLGIPNEAIKKVKKLGSGAYGTSWEVQIEGITYLPPNITYAAKEFKGQLKHQWKGFASEGAIDLNHTGIVRCIAHSKRQPWLLIFPFFNGGTLGDLMETVPCPHGTFTSLVAMQDGKGKILPSFKWKQPSEEILDRAKSICAHGPSLIHALVKALRFAHDEGIIHNDLHPWNIMLDFTKDLTPRIGIIDWGLALRVGLEFQKTNNTDANWQKLHPWRAEELMDGKNPCPWTKATDVYAIAWNIWQFCTFCAEFSDQYSTDWCKKKISVEIQAISRLVLDGWLKKKASDRRTIELLDEELERFEAHPETCLCPLSEMTLSFFG